MNENQNIQDSLKSLINQTYQIEKEYKALNKSYLRLQSFIQSIVEALPNAIWVLNSDKSVFLQNSTAQKCEELLLKIDLNQSRQEIHFNDLFFQVLITQKDDRTIICANDITNEKRSERLASMGQISAHLAHEIRNPIGSISLLTSTLLKKIPANEQEIVNEMQKAIWRVERIIKATLLFTKGVTPKWHKFDLFELKNECYDLVKFYTFSKKISFKFNFQKCEFVGDKDLLIMVFQNLIFNAIDAIEANDEENGEIAINFTQNEQFCEFVVLDSGEEIVDKNILFEPFKTTKLKGNGLGLSLCVQIINAHGGEISLNLSPKRFCIKLPKRVENLD